MKTHKMLALLCTLSLAIFFSCGDKTDTTPDLNITVLDPTDMTESGFTAHWSINKTNITTLRIELAQNNDFAEIVKEISLNDPSQTSQWIDGLHGATKYYLRVIATLDDGTSGTSLNKTVQTSYQSEDANVITSDGIHIAGDLYYLNSNPAKSPAIILMGHMSIINMWKNDDVFLNLLAQGYVCYVFNYRGHGPSEYWDIISIETLEEIAEFVRDYASKDLEACYTYLRGHAKVDSTRIGLMGGSLGANESMIGNGWPGVKVSVGLTNSRVGLENTGILQNVLFVVSELDCNALFCFKDETEILYNNAAEPKKMIVIPGDFHGLDMLLDKDLIQEILDWINARMEE